MALRDVLFFNSAGNLEAGTTPLLNERVTSSSPSDKEILQYDGTNSEWVLVSGANAIALDGKSLSFGTLSTGDVIYYDGTNWTNGTLGGGLQFSGGSLSVKEGDGITTDVSGNLTIDKGPGLKFNGGVLEVDTGNGVTFNGDSLEIATGAGLTFNGSSVEIDAGNGLTFNGNVLEVAPGADPGDVTPNDFQDVADRLNDLLQALRDANLIV